MATAYKGNSAVRETPESGRRTFSANESLEVIKRGKYADLATEQPLKGAEYVTGYTVEQSTLSRMRGGWGELVVQLVEKDTSTQIIPVGALDSTIEGDMAQVERAIVANPKLALSDSAAGIIAAWRDSPQQRRRKFQVPLETLTKEPDPDVDDEWEVMDEDNQKVALKILKGIESWIDFYPVVTRTSTYKVRPDPADCGKRQFPPVSVPGTYSWLKTADRIVQNARKQYVRTEQWTASDAWDPDLYEAAT